MSSLNPAAARAPHDTAAQQAEDAQYYRGVLHELIDLGTDLARTVQKQAKAQAAAAPSGAAPSKDAPDLVAAFDRIARTVRRTILLARKVGEPPPRPAPDPAAARRHAIRTVEDRMRGKVRGEQADALHAELLDRLDRPECASDLLSRPIADVITEICRDLGLDNYPGMAPWPRRTPRDIARLCAQAEGQRPPPAPPPPPPPPPEPGDPPEMDALIHLAQHLIQTG